MSDGSSPLPAPEAPRSPDRRRERRIVLALLAGLTVLRSAVLVWFEGAHFDSDQALIGLMAKHLIEGRALPVFTYAQPYMLGVEAWLAAPFILVGGLTVTMLKMPLLLINVAITVLLVLSLERWGGLRPMLAAVPALFFALAPPGTTTLFLEASGGNVEPFLIVILLWMARRRPLAFGAILALGVLQREFAIYAAGAFIVLRLVDGSVRRPVTWRPAALAALSFAAVWQVVYIAKQFSSVDGPGTSVGGLAASSANVEAVVTRVCLDPSLVPSGIYAVLTSHFASILGAEPRALVEYGINSTQAQGAGWLWPLVGGSLLLMLGRLTWLAARQRVTPWHPRLEYAAYLALVGIQALAVYGTLRCDAMSVGTMRYALLGVFAAVGLVTGFLRLEPSRWLRRLGIGIVIVWAGSVSVDHGRLAAEYAFDRPPNPRRELADRLVDEGIRFAYGDYWESLSTTYLTNEQVIVASTGVVFLDEYQWLVRRHADEAAAIERRSCPEGIEVADWLYICPPEADTGDPDVGPPPVDDPADAGQPPSGLGARPDDP